VVRRVTSLLNSQKRAVNGARILLLGLAYKAGTSDWRESPAMRTAELLLALGADVRAHDAHVPIDATLGPPITRVDLTAEEIEQADLVVLLVDHPELPYDAIAKRAKLVLDTRGRLRGLPFRGEVL
jgi:UDP-N-acetyl-D-mannosaminuronate dehydrogenase